MLFVLSAFSPLQLAENEFSSVFRLLTLFAYGTYADYLSEAGNLPPLSKAQKNKLRHLSVVTLAAKIKCIPYAVLLEQLQLKNVRQLEDLVIEAVYADVLRGSLDQRNQRLEVDYSIGRDIRREELSTITRTLQEWCLGCEVVLSGIEEQVSRANQHKEQQLGLKQQIESECIPYAVLLEQLQLKNVRQLEDLVIEAVYADVLRGSLDQRNQRLEVDYSIGRDIRREELSTITRTLQEWCLGCEVVLSGIEEQVSRANQHKEQQLGLKQQIESEVANLKKTIKVTTAAAAAATSQDPEQHLTELREPAPGTNQRQASKKASKAKGSSSSKGKVGTNREHGFTLSGEETGSPNVSTQRPSKG
ncbi:COP9 signalosome complex subunit 7a [Chelonia mydas]|uniref:COP9 signalosome complex subunit 7a n=1 Tax=Chelonia mydas TaxID=8469 RepID=M7C1N6_CHEMY|nr:COP9 signalosome complex subunit 7a [Chelonia mydas]